MPPTIDDAFSTLLSRIELNPTRVALASQRYNAIKDVVEANLPGATVRQIGSFQRRTKIRPRDLSDALDVDALAVLGEARTYATDGDGVTPAAALKRVRDALRRDKTYRVMDPQLDAPVVSLEYADGFKMEVAVGYRELTGKYPREPSAGSACYIVADGGNWKPADYDFDAEQISKWNQAWNGALVPIIKIAKQWLRAHEVPLKSFHVEILAASVLPTAWAEWRQKNWTWGFPHSLASFLERAHMLAGARSLSGSYSPAIDSGLSLQQLREVGSYLKDESEQAWKLCGENDFERAVLLWQRFYGEPFPPASGVE